MVVDWGSHSLFLAPAWNVCMICTPMFLSQEQNFAMGSLAQISSGSIRCSFNTRFRTRFRRVLVHIPREVLEGSGADISWGSEHLPAGRCPQDSHTLGRSKDDHYRARHGDRAHQLLDRRFPARWAGRKKASAGDQGSDLGKCRASRWGWRDLHCGSRGGDSCLQPK